MAYKRSEIPMIITLVVGLLILGANFFDVNALTNAANLLVGWGSSLAAFSIFYGTFTLYLFFYKRVSERDEDWMFYGWALVILTITFIIGLIPPFGDNEWINWVLFYVRAPTRATLSALSGLSIMSAVYRSMRARSFEASIFMIACIIMICRNSELFGLEPIGDWVFNYVMVSGTRAIIIGAGIGTIALGVRTLLGKERGVALKE